MITTQGWLSPSAKTALIYIIFSVLYITISDRAVLFFFSNSSNDLLSKIQTIKGNIFVISSGLLIYFIVKLNLSRLKNAQDHTNEMQHINDEIVNSLNDGFAVLDKNQNLITSNQNFFDILEITPKRKKKNTNLQSISNQEILNTITAFLGGTSNNASTTIKLHTNKWINIHLFKIQEIENHTLTIFRCENITELVLKEKHLLENERDFLAIFKRIPFGVILYDAEERIKFSNYKASAWLNLNKEELVRDKILDLIPDKEMEDIKKMWFEALNKNIYQKFSTKLKSQSENNTWIQFDVIPIKKYEKRGQVMILTDITSQVLMQKKNTEHSEELKHEVAKRTCELQENNFRLEESQKALTYLLEDVNEIRDELTLSNELLKSANKEMEAFSYSVSHDLRAPLRSINGFSNALMEDYAEKLDKEGLDNLNRIRKSAIKMGELIDDLLVLSRVSRREMNTDHIHISKIAELVVSELYEIEPERKIEIEIQDDIQGYGDLNLTKILLFNLLENAWKFTSKVDQPKITFRLDNGEFMIKDNGVGFSTKYAAKIFEPFQRLHTNQEYSGTGIGLAIVHRIVQRHNGSIRVESKPGHGTTFYFQLLKESEELNTTA